MAQNRQSSTPNRYLVTPVDTSIIPSFTATLTLNDDPTVIGTPINVDTFLKPSTALLYGYSSPATIVPDDIFVDIYNMLAEIDITGLQAQIAQEIIDRQTGDTNLQNTKEPLIATSTVDNFWAGNKSWQSFPTTTLAVVLTGLNTSTNSAIVATDTILAAFGKLQAHLTVNDTVIASKQTNITVGTTAQYYRGDKTWFSFNTSVLSSVLTGLLTDTSTPIAGTDTVIQAMGKLQAQINTNITQISDDFSTLSRAINNTNTNLSNETTARQQEDTNLQNNINTLNQVLSANIQSNATAIANETTNRQAQDTLINQSISELNTNLRELITQNTTLINQEQTRAINTENLLEQTIENQGTNLQTNINNLQTNFEATYTILENNISTLQTNLANETTNRINNDIVSFTFDNINNLTLTKGNASTLTAEIPFADEVTAGLMTATAYESLTNNSGLIQTMLNGLWCGAQLGLNPTQAALTNAWLEIMGGSSVPIGARITNFDTGITQLNIGDYFYLNLASDIGWYQYNASSTPNFTQATSGLILGSAAENNVKANLDGTGTVVGLADFKAATNTALENKFDKGATIEITGDGSASSTELTNATTLSFTLANSGATAGTYGNASTTVSDGGNFTILSATVNAKGLLTTTASSTITLTPARSGVLTGLSTATNAAVVATDSIVVGIGKLQAHLTANDTAISGKEPTIESGTTAQYWRGDKSWQNLNSAVIGSTLTGLDTSTNSAIAATDTILAAFGKLQAHLTANDTAISGKEPTISDGTTDQYWRGDKSWTDFGTTTRGITLTGLSTSTNAAITSSDTILSALGKLQSHLAANDTAISGKQAQLNGTGFVVMDGTTVSYDDSEYVKTTTAQSIEGVKTFTDAPIFTGLTTSSTDSYDFLRIDSSNNMIRTTGATVLGIIGGQAALNGTGFVKASGTTISYDNTTYEATSALADDVRGIVLTGLSTSTNSAIVATDSILVAFGKAQAQIDELQTLSPYSMGVYNGVLSSYPGGTEIGISTLDITVVYGTIQTGMVLTDTNGNRGILLNYNSTDNTGDVRITQKGLETVKTVMRATTTYVVVSIDVLNRGTGYTAGTTYQANGVSFSPTAVSATGQLIPGSISFTAGTTYSTNVAGASFSVTGTPGSGATVAITTSYAPGYTETTGNLKFVPPADPLVQKSYANVIMNGTAASKKQLLFTANSNGSISITYS